MCKGSQVIAGIGEARIPKFFRQALPLEAHYRDCLSRLQPRAQPRVVAALLRGCGRRS
jgi:hypothetical protein